MFEHVECKDDTNNGLRQYRELEDVVDDDLEDVKSFGPSRTRHGFKTNAENQKTVIKMAMCSCQQSQRK